MLLLGIDDAGRGPLIGPMFLAGVLLHKKDEQHLKEEGVADSKTLVHPRRVQLAGLIHDVGVKSMVVATTPEQIDHAIASGVNLNTLEAMKAAEIVNELTKGVKEKVTVIVDCPSVNTKAWKATLMGYVHEKEHLEVRCEHKADANHVVVSAASILAKVAREEAVTEIKKKFGDIGSGYPSDPFTVAFLKNHGKEYRDSGIFRKSWATWTALFPEDAPVNKGKRQKTLEEF